ncbi:hypothetical protein HMPREF1219_02101 [Corynebacterium pyruviciproducens ATCC BAA-1742]|uniref:DUF304 domain-containing protein n=1 Tax=Corynebacterium pyruviciproducens ATCC BAA-1742 TaxID=1125779 RepID=S2YTG6_9CORY|nr:PH domain-containing protein [Corynebacterium pyruviciproducens]EPD67688.1 hypothetical protein HMPREF1219_02101 [Corynebacterium pyruviciproducens ATCC BAA-1742]
MKLEPGEVILADVTTPFRHLTMPVVQLILATGVCSMALGVFDRPGGPELLGVALPPAWRPIVLAVWAVWVVVGFLWPVLMSRTARTTITTKRIVTRKPGLFTRSRSVFLEEIDTVHRRSGDLVVSLYDEPRPLVIRHMPKTKQLVRLIESGY